ncbi:Coenzyme F420 hydrogenase/dehydrogenase, beta subunit C-terminal domain [Selenomonas ruminantium]|uniref:Coenzyme F420 hydrogenase/dehydrogenase, beta subunit C-terminal domain n=1 Tax=Selenomonas ruminantium TaxID=971 RepID=UPI000404D3D7|nr:Coenzyme F420 hydrogenase/dehydrogenase, beta subunit C-terminal domain [Selenomonas ruminantium]
MKTVCEKNKCSGCMACFDVCPKDAIEFIDDIEYFNAVIDEEKCINCNACHTVCQKENPAELKEPVAWYQGWARDQEVRSNSSSGGYANAICKAFIENGGIVASCKLSNGDFRFFLARDYEEMQGFAGSKYVKSNAAGIYKQVKRELIKGRKVLFLGVPCQVSAMINYVGKKLLPQLYTIDLICHGSPSKKILDMALKEYGYTWPDINKIDFRNNTKFQLRINMKNVLPIRVQEKYMYLFLNGVNYTENCYSCYYATGKRVGDVTLGDSWGSELNDEEMERGISLALIQSEKGKSLIDMASLNIYDVDLEKAKIPNTQLRHPVRISKEHDEFFKQIRSGKSFCEATKKTNPFFWYKQDIKKIMLKLNIIKDC